LPLPSITLPPRMITSKDSWAGAARMRLSMSPKTEHARIITIVLLKLFGCNQVESTRFSLAIQHASSPGVAWMALLLFRLVRIGFVLRPTQKPAPVMSWPERLKEWLTERNIWKP
jgi:hypothetical protein